MAESQRPNCIRCTCVCVEIQLNLSGAKVNICNAHYREYDIKKEKKKSREPYIVDI